MKHTVYLMLSLTHIKDGETRKEILNLVRRLEASTKIELLPWAFDLDTWKPKPVPSVFLHDFGHNMKAKLGVALYLTSDGSDGRGDEVATRARSRKPMIALRKEGVRPNAYVDDMLRHFEADPIQTFSTIDEIEERIVAALKELDQQLSFFDPVHQEPHVQLSIFDQAQLSAS
jgi:hypothetical protein